MKLVLKSTVMMVVVFGLAALVFSGCGQTTTIKSKPQTLNDGVAETGPAPVRPVQSSGGSQYQNVKQINSKDIERECTTDEVSRIRSLETQIANSNAMIDSTAGKKSDQALAQAIQTVRSCDAVIAQQQTKPCKRTVKNIISTTVEYYDAYRISLKCLKSEDYTIKFNARPTQSVAPVTPVAPAPTKPTTPPTARPTPVPTAPTNPDMTTGNLRQCNNDEWNNLKSGMGLLDIAKNNVNRLGLEWKYDGVTVSNTQAATRACETLIYHHISNPCAKDIKQNNGSILIKNYTRETLTERCETVRTYYYEYAQNTKTLNFKNANLYLELSTLGNKLFEAGYMGDAQGCRIENPTSQTIDYSGQETALIKDSRGFESKMMVLETQEGLLIQCYGLNIDGPFSKRQVVRVLKDSGSDIRLRYQLK